MTSSLRPITWVLPLGRLRFGASASSGEDTARFWISLCCSVVAIAANDVLGRRAEALREGAGRAHLELTDELVRAVTFDACHEIGVIRCIRHVGGTTQFALA